MVVYFFILWNSLSHRLLLFSVDSASVCISCWCHALAAGQVITRLQLNWLGKPTESQAEKANAFPTLFTISMIYFSLKIFLFFIIVSMMPDDPEEPPPDSVQPFANLSDVINYADHCAGTLATSPTRLNPYKLGIELFRHIEDRWNRGCFGREYEQCEDARDRARRVGRTGRLHVPCHEGL